MKRIVYTVLASLLLFMSVPEVASASSADNLINIGKKYMGTKYRYGGTTTKGFDCSGYTQYVFREAGTPISRTTGGQYSQGKAVSKANLKTGDLVFFNTSGRGVSHVGIFIKGGKFIHASTSQGVTITPLNDPYYWGKRYIGARRVKEFNQETAVAAPPKKPAPVAPAINYVTRSQVAQELAKALKISSKKAPNFSDVAATHPNASAIAALNELGIFEGDASGKFNPDKYLSRTELAKVLTKSFNLTKNPAVQAKAFKDVSSTYWGKPYIDTLSTNGIARGYTDGRFGTTSNVKDSELRNFINAAK